MFSAFLQLCLSHSKWILLFLAPLSLIYLYSNPTCRIYFAKGLSNPDSLHVVIETVVLCLPWACLQLHSTSILLQNFRPKHLAVRVTPHGVHGGASGFCSQQPLKPYSCIWLKMFLANKELNYLCTFFSNLSFQSVKSTSDFLGSFRMENYNHLGPLIVKSFAGSPLPTEYCWSPLQAIKALWVQPHIQPLIRFLNLGFGIHWSSKQYSLHILFLFFWKVSQSFH